MHINQFIGDHFSRLPLYTYISFNGNNGLYGLFGQGSLNHIFFSYCEHRVLGGLVDVSPGGQPEKVPQGRDSQGGSCHWRVRGKIY